MSLAPETDRSYTEHEYDIAVRANKRCLMFVAPEEFTMPAHLIESDELRAKQSQFRANVLQRFQSAFFDDDAHDLSAKVLQALFNE